MRLVGVGVLAGMAARQGVPLLGELTAWDGQWYLGIAERGYDGVGEASLDADGQPYSSAPYGFFPLYPGLVSAVADVPGLSTATAGLIVSSVAGLAGVPAIMRIAAHVDPRPRVGLLLVVLAAGAPMAITLSMVYTEALWVAVIARTGQTWQEVEWVGWHFRWDFGAEALEWITRGLLDDSPVMVTVGVCVVLGAMSLAALGAVRRLPWPLVAYGAGIVVLMLGSSGIPHAKPRFILVGAFVLLIPVAVGLARRRTSTQLAALTLFVLGCAWYSAHALAVWRYAI
ncbi:hypothetical protein FHU38_004916 [Saccharomonospora amisosensis]|uniref:Mannosyltransferase (PIG-V) n=1 Tax=Saccharomonospora amisosensis TaxID=1128677 RepID=A0A7X5ZTP2_9PSEU|nr:hypothetical protein [Saccharomonospora amisosensis]NIJ14515.1 hypothetical protein [Saccharomonospora amisosensis]